MIEFGYIEIGKITAASKTANRASLAEQNLAILLPLNNHPTCFAL
jgi:hypothetical protein